jgi:hypothetical protein
MTRDQADNLALDLDEVFKDLDVAIGLVKLGWGKYGVAIRSQDPQVDAQNIGKVRTR